MVYTKNSRSVSVPAIKNETHFSHVPPNKETFSIPVNIPEDEPANSTPAPQLIKRFARTKVRKCCSVKTLKKKVPITSWLPKYNVDCLVGDLIAGISVGMTVIPQSMAYANLAGLDVQYGLYSAFMGCFIYMIFGSCSAITIGPTAIMSMMTHEYAPTGYPDFAILACFLAGCIEFALGLLNLGFIIDFISVPVTSGFVTAAALSIATSQLGKFFGIHIEGESTIEQWVDFFRNVQYTRKWDITMAVCALALLIFLRESKRIKWGNADPEKQSTGEKIGKTMIWLCSTGRNAIVLVLCTVIGYCTYDTEPLNLTKEPPPGLPPFQAPPFSTEMNGEDFSFGDMCSKLGAGLIVLPLVAILESVAIAKAFSKGKAVDASQEMLALGLCNIMGSFVSSYPVTGSFGRTAVNSASGVKTPAGGIITGAIVLLALGVLTSTFKYIPDACLAAVIIGSVIYTAEFEELKRIWHTKKIDLLPWLLTFILSLATTLEYGIIAGIILSLIFLLYSSARPAYRHLQVTEPSNIMIVTPKGGLYYPSVSYFREKINKTGVRNPDKIILVDATYVQGADYTTAEGIKALTSDFSRRDQKLIFVGIKPGIMRVLQGLKPQNFVTFPTLRDVPTFLFKG